LGSCPAQARIAGKARKAVNGFFRKHRAFWGILAIIAHLPKPQQR
jgi:hypothetical protein